MLGKYIQVDSVQYPNPTSYAESFMDVENVVISEDGRDLTTVTRLQKLIANVGYRVTSEWMNKIKSDCMRLKVRMTIDNKTYEGRMRITASTLVPYSEENPETNGFWDVSFTFTEI